MFLVTLQIQLNWLEYKELTGLDFNEYYSLQNWNTILTHTEPTVPPT